MKIYLDNCCFNRPFDNQDSLSIKLETQAKLFIQECIKNNKFDLIWSFILEFENQKNPYIDRKRQTLLWKKIATIIIIADEVIINKAENFVKIGIKSNDALHIASAIKANGEYFITTDKGILKKANLISEIRICNPIEFVRNYEGEFL